MHSVRWPIPVVAVVVAVAVAFAAAISSGCSAVSARIDVPSQSAPDGGNGVRDALAPDRPADAGGVDATDAAIEAAAAATAAERPDPAAEHEEDGERTAEESLDDEPDEGQFSEPGQSRPHPLDGWTSTQMLQTVVTDPKFLGSMSIGRANGGWLVNAIPMEPGDGWVLVKPARAWGTQETVEGLTRCIARVQIQFPNTPPVFIGDLSAPNGGSLSPHKSHQSGRDVDVGYYYTNRDVPWYARATAGNLDRARTWAFVRALITETDVEYLFIDRGLQTLLRDYAYRIGEPKAWVDSIFDGGPNLRPIILHAKGHATHIHVRFYSPVAQETARRVHALLVERRVLSAEGVYVSYVEKNGDTLAKVAKRAGANAKSLQEVNRIKATMVRAAAAEKRATRRSAPPPPTATAVLLFPARRLPPAGTPVPAAATGGATAGNAAGAPESARAGGSRGSGSTQMLSGGAVPRL